MPELNWTFAFIIKVCFLLLFSELFAYLVTYGIMTAYYDRKLRFYLKVYSSTTNPQQNREEQGNGK